MLLLVPIVFAKKLFTQDTVRPSMDRLYFRLGWANNFWVKAYEIAFTLYVDANNYKICLFSVFEMDNFDPYADDPPPPSNPGRETQTDEKSPNCE